MQKFLISGTIHSHSQRHSHLILDPGSAFYDHFRGGEAPSEVIVVCRSRMKDQVAMAVADNLVVTKNQQKIFGPFILHQVRFCIKFIFLHQVRFCTKFIFGPIVHSSQHSPSQAAGLCISVGNGFCVGDTGALSPTRVEDGC